MTGIIYGSSTGNTESAAEIIKEKWGEATVSSIRDVSLADLEGFDFLILGSSTWGAGDLQDEWEDNLSMLEGANLTAKKAAIFGLGDQIGFGDTFVDGMKALYEVLVSKGIEVVGSWSTEGYDFESSVSVVNGKFVGLALDEDNQSDLTEERISAWVETLKG